LRTRLGESDEPARPLLASWPIERPENWTALVNVFMTAAELEALRLSLKRGAPYGTTRWQANTADQLGLAPTLRPRGRPRRST
jgi:putative transposase